MISRSRLGWVAYAHLAAAGVGVESPSSPRVPTSLDDAAHALGAVIAAVHEAFDDLVLTGDDDPWSWTLGPSTLTGADSTWLERGLHGSDDELAVLVAWRAQTVERLPQDEAPEGLCHGEVYPATCRYQDDGQS